MRTGIFSFYEGPMLAAIPVRTADRSDAVLIRTMPKPNCKSIQNRCLTDPRRHRRNQNDAGVDYNSTENETETDDEDRHLQLF